MNVNDIIKSEMFSSPEDWNSFLELINHKGKIIGHWYEKATDRLVEVLRGKGYNGWSFYTAGNNKSWHRDVRLNLKDFSRNDLGIRFAWNYEFHLSLGENSILDSALVDDHLKRREFDCIQAAFSKIKDERSYGRHTKYMHYRNFSYGSISDGNLSVDELAWFAGNRTDEFVQECVAMIEKFTCDPAVTEALRELHLRSLVVTNEVKAT